MKTLISLKNLERIEIDHDNNVAIAIYKKEKLALEVGEWSQADDKDVYWLVLDENMHHCGFNKGVWYDYDKDATLCTHKHFKWNKPDMDEVKRLLIAEAKKRGFNKGVKCKGALVSNHTQLLDNDIYELAACGLYIDRFLIFSTETGKWAEIIEEKKLLYLIRKSDKKMFLQESSLDKFAEDDIHTKSMTEKECYQYLTDHCEE